jgi:hypothetical protein
MARAAPAHTISGPWPGPALRTRRLQRQPKGAARGATKAEKSLGEAMVRAKPDVYGDEAVCARGLDEVHSAIGN